jgi:hypothetical protein
MLEPDVDMAGTIDALFTALDTRTAAGSDAGTDTEGGRRGAAS